MGGQKMKVYLASPYTKGDIARNVFRQMEVADVLIKKGHAPFIPLLYHFQHMYFPQEYQTWTTIDLEWVQACDCLLRLAGDSERADAEEAFAKDLGMPVYYSETDIPE
jgi:hypothetical protein